MRCCAVLCALLNMLFCRCQVSFEESKQSYQVPTDLSLAHQLSSANQGTAALAQRRGAVPGRAVWYCAVLCRAVRCCVMLYLPCALLYMLIRTGQVSLEVSYQAVLHQVCTYCIVESQKMQSQLSSVQLLLNSAARPLALPCGVVPCCAFFFCIYSTRYHATYQVPGTGMNMCTRLFAFCVYLYVLSRFSLCFFLRTLHPYTADQNVTSPTSTQHSSGQSALQTQ